MLGKNTARKFKKRRKKIDFLQGLDRLGGNKLAQPGTDVSFHGKGSRQHSVNSKKG
jgi:hypothetical protein